VLVFGADHIYRMDVRQMLDFHRDHNADVTVAALPVPRQEARAFGVIGCDHDGRIRSFLEKPDDPPAMPGDPTRSFASMGNYCFRADALVAAIHECAGIDDLDFGRHVLPRMLAQGRRLHAYDFATNRIPGQRDAGGYWRDVGTLDAYFDATLDTLGAHPQFELGDPSWPIRVAGRTWPRARLLRAEVRDAQIGPGALVRDARISGSVIRRAATVDEGAELDNCIVLDGARIERGARLRRVIVDRNAHVPAHARIGFDRDEDGRLHLVTPSGITIVTHPS
jgi:glucose-1-phosphate adenylyltransferase